MRAAKPPPKAPRARGKNSGGDAQFVHCDVRDKTQRRSRDRRDGQALRQADHPSQQCRRLLATGWSGHGRVGRRILARDQTRSVRHVSLLARSAFPLIIKSGGGCVINMTSTLALNAVPGRDCYTAAKGAIASMTRSMAVEYRAAQNSRQRDRPVGHAVGPGQEVAGRLQGYREAGLEPSARAWTAHPHGQHGGLPRIGRGGDHDRADHGGR